MTLEKSIQIRVSHRYVASPERVFDAWLDPQKACRFLFATATGSVVRTEIDARVGGAFTIVDRRAGEDVEHVGTYLEIDRPRRLVFSFRVPRYSDESDTVSIEIQPLGSGCELTLTHEMGGRWASVSERARGGWQLILEVLAELAHPDEPSCGQGLALHASVPAKIAVLFAGLADTLELHRALLAPAADAAARQEDDAYTKLATSYREIAARIAETSAFMADCASLTPCPHDTSAFGAEHLRAFERFVQAQSQLFAILRPAVDRDQNLLASMTRAS